MDIELVEEYKYLGVYLDPKVSFNRHTEYLTKKAIGRLGTLGKTRKFVSQETSLLMYKSLLVPVLDCGDIVYDGLSAQNSNKIQKVQNSAV